MRSNTGLAMWWRCAIALVAWSAAFVTSRATTAAPGDAAQPGEDELRARRLAMVGEQIEARGIRDDRVLESLRKVPRHRFVPARLISSAYDDTPLPIGYNQTISQPYIVAYMSEALRLTPKQKVLEVGTGSGYQAAVLGELAGEVYTIELIPELARQAQHTLETLGYGRIHVREGDGYLGWPEAAPFDRIIVTAAPDHVPQPLVDQLAVGGLMVIPVGTVFQWMTIIEKTGKGVVRRETIPVRFVPLVHKPD